MALVLLFVAFILRLSVDGQSTVGSDDINYLTCSAELQNGILQEIRNLFESLTVRLEALEQTGKDSCESSQFKVNSSQFNDILDKHFKNMTQSLHSLTNRLEAQAIQNGREFREALQLQFQNLSRLSEEQFSYRPILSTPDRRLKEYDQYTRTQSSPAATARPDACDSVTRSTDCADLAKTGMNVSDVYQICVLRPGLAPLGMSVYCDLSSSHSSWLVFQRRKDGSENFYRTWVEYQNGFGNLTGEFWLGNNALHLLTSNRNYKLRIELENFDGEKRYAEYAQFDIGPASDNYRLNVSGYSGNAGDSLTHHNGFMFSTKDADHDSNVGVNCAERFQGAWWYSNGCASNLNGLYLRRNATSSTGIVWNAFRNFNSLKYVEMKIGPRN